MGMEQFKVEIIEFPLEQEEQARQEAKSLLAREVYKSLAELIKRSLDRLRPHSNAPITLDKDRVHQAILIDGARGTGKSTVLVNLETYLSSDINKSGLNVADLLILSPVDPTLLEDDDDLLLNVVVSALVRHPDVKAKLGESRSEGFYRQLESVGNALEAVQTHKGKYGIEKLRAFMGNHGLAEEIHKLFRAALSLTGRRLLILPIDDVDMSISRGMDNLEIVRKYLASPYVLPIISGDMALYDEIVWREFHGKLGKSSKAEDGNAVSIAQNMSESYRRKVMPIPRRLRMPDVQTYLAKWVGSSIKLLCADSPIYLTMADIGVWLDAFLNERTNGAENSRLEIQIGSVRELAQLLSVTRNAIAGNVRESGANLAKLLENKKENSLEGIKRLLFMPASVQDEIVHFQREYHAAQSEPDGEKRRKMRNDALQRFRDKVGGCTDQTESLVYEKIIWAETLKSYAFNHSQGGVVYLVMDTYLKWLDLDWKSLSGRPEPEVLSSPLFEPVQQERLGEFKGRHIIRDEWRQHLGKGKVPESWLERLPTHSLLPYPLPELGSQMASQGHFKPDDSDFISYSERKEFVRLLMVDHNFYSAYKMSAMVFCGRLFELVVLSLVRDPVTEDIEDILNRHPYYSLPSMAATKTLYFDAAQPVDFYAPSFIPLSNEEVGRGLRGLLIDFVEGVKVWRQDTGVSSMTPHPWFIYCVMNKFFNQAGLFNPNVTGDTRGSFSALLTLALKAFYALWSTIGSFEKGPVFGLDLKVAHQNVSDPSGFKPYPCAQLIRHAW